MAFSSSKNRCFNAFLALPALAMSLAWAQQEQGNGQEGENPGDTPFLMAVWDNDAEAIGRLLARGADPNQTTAEGYGAIHLATLSENFDLLPILSLGGSDIDMEDRAGNTAVHLTARTGSRQGIRSLHKARADLNSVNHAGLTPLEVALMNEHYYVAEYLADRGGTFGAGGDGGMPPISRLVMSGISVRGWDIIDDMMTVREVNRADEDKVAPIHLAAAIDRPEVIIRLIAAGAYTSSEDDMGNSPIHHAVLANVEDSIGVLVDGGADPDHVDRNGDTPLYKAAKSGAQKALKALLDAGADPLKRSSNGRLPLHGAAIGSSDSIWLLLDNGAEINARDAKGETPLHLATDSGNLEEMKALLLAGANPNIGDDQGYTPVFLAVAHDTLDPLKLLLENGATLNHTANNGQTAADMAREVQKGKLAMELFILQVLPGY